VSPKVKTTKGKGIGVRSGVEGRVGAPGWRLGRLTHKLLTNQTISWLVHNWSTFGARISHM